MTILRGPEHRIELCNAAFEDAFGPRPMVGLTAREVFPELDGQPFFNLAINARDAMPASGELLVEAANVRLDQTFAAVGSEVTPGEYVCLAVSDTGTGMSPEVLARAFDPFFTTKPLGQGTGVGLSMIYGFARQSGGHASIDSEESRGTTVKLYLPRLVDPERADPSVRSARDRAALPSGKIVLLAEDDDVVRDLVATVLREAGCIVVEAWDGLSALAILRSPQPLHLLVSDIGLPGLDGRQVVEAARPVRPGLKVLFLTGYAENAAAQGFLEPGVSLITKPFAIAVFLQQVETLLGV